MLLSWIFAAILIVVVLVYYFLPKRQVCAGCGVAREAESPLCSACGWIHEEPDLPDDDPDEDPLELEDALADDPDSDDRDWGDRGD